MTDPRRLAADSLETGAEPPRGRRFVDREGTSWALRPFEPADRTSLIAMYREFAPDRRADGLPPADEDRLVAWLDTLLEEGYNVVAARNGCVAGHAAYTPADAPEPELVVFVHQDYQGQGIGTALCRQLVAAARAAGRDGLVLEVDSHNRRAIGIYERLGFERVEPSVAGRRRCRQLTMRRPVETAPLSATHTAEAVEQPS